MSSLPDLQPNLGLNPRMMPPSGVSAVSTTECCRSASTQSDWAEKEAIPFNRTTPEGCRLVKTNLVHRIMTGYTQPLLLDCRSGLHTRVGLSGYVSDSLQDSL